MKNFISVNDAGNIDALLSKALDFKRGTHTLSSSSTTGKNMGVMFFNPSMRTRLSTQIAARNLGVECFVFNVDKEGWSMEFEDGVIMNGTSVEHIRDAAPVFSSYFDIIGIRTFPTLGDRDYDYSEYVLNSFIKYCSIPVVSLESATLHPLQSLADLITITEQWQSNSKPKIVLTWAPHIKPLPQCVANSFAEWISAWDKSDFVITHPEGYELSETYTKGATIEYDQEKALKDADFVYVKNWSMYHRYGQISTGLEHWMLTPDKMASTNQGKVMHCLPVRRNLELSDAVLDAPQSIVTQQAANRVWSAQAVIHSLLDK